MRNTVISSIKLSREVLTPDFININMTRAYPDDINTNDKFYLQKHVIDISDAYQMAELENSIDSQTVLAYMSETNFMSAIVHFGGGDIPGAEIIDITSVILNGYDVIVDNLAPATNLYIYRIFCDLYLGSNQYEEQYTDYVYGLSIIDIEDGTLTDPETGEKLPTLGIDPEEAYEYLGDVISDIPDETLANFGVNNTTEIAYRLREYTRKNKIWPYHYNNFRYRGPLEDYKYQKVTNLFNQHINIINNLKNINENVLTNLKNLLTSSQTVGLS